MAETEDAIDITQNEEEDRFETTVGGDLAYLTYGEEGGRFYLLHTEVPKQMEGRGIGSRLVVHALEHARGNGLKVIAFCPFAKTYLQRHKSDYADLLPTE